MSDSALPDDQALTIDVLSQQLSEHLGASSNLNLLIKFVELLRSVTDTHTRISIAEDALSNLSSKLSVYEEQDVAVREILADAYEDQEQYSDAIRVLKSIKLESTQRSISDDDRVKMWVRIMRLYLEEGDAASAETYLSRAKAIFYLVPSSNKEMHLMFSLSQARILDASHKFLDAAQAYLDISTSMVLAKEERTRALSAAITCAILAPAGAQRNRMLTRLYKDERSERLTEYSILSKIYMDSLISPTEAKAFAAKLEPHHRAATADGLTVVDKAMLEHNLLAIAKLYENIRIEELSLLLGLGEGETGCDRAEEYAGRMIEEGRLKAAIDKIDDVVFFENQQNDVHRGKSGAKIYPEISRWDSKVRGLAEDLEKVTTLLEATYPEYLESTTY